MNLIPNFIATALAATLATVMFALFLYLAFAFVTLSLTPTNPELLWFFIRVLSVPLWLLIFIFSWNK